MDAINPRRTPGIPGSVLHWHQTLPSAALQVLQGTWSAWAAFLPQRCSGSHVTFLPVPVRSWAPGEGGWGAQTWCSMPIEMVDYLPYAVTAFLQGISHGVVVHIHTEVAICVVSWVEVGDHPRGNPQAPKHYKPRSVWGCWLWWRWHVNTPRYYPLTHKRHTHPYYLCWGSQQRPSTGQIGLAWSQIFSSSWGFLHCHSRSLGPGHQHNCHSNSQKEHRCHHCYWSVQKHPPHPSESIPCLSYQSDLQDSEHGVGGGEAMEPWVHLSVMKTVANILGGVGFMSLEVLYLMDHVWLHLNDISSVLQDDREGGDSTVCQQQDWAQKSCLQKIMAVCLGVWVVSIVWSVHTRAHVPIF